MLIVVFSSVPEHSVQFEQGLEVALAAADLELEVKVIIEGACAKALLQVPTETIWVKKMRQLELYAIPCVSAAPISVLTCEQLPYPALRELLGTAHAVLVV